MKSIKPHKIISFVVLSALLIYFIYMFIIPQPYPLSSRIRGTTWELRTVSDGLNNYYSQYSTYPLNLINLTTPIAYLNIVPTDRFMIPRTKDIYIYHNLARDKAILYSKGPDKIDDNGKLIYDPTNGIKSHGDILFILESGKIIFPSLH